MVEGGAESDEPGVVVVKVVFDTGSRYNWCKNHDPGDPVEKGGWCEDHGADDCVKAKEGT